MLFNVQCTAESFADLIDQHIEKVLDLFTMEKLWPCLHLPYLVVSVSSGLSSGWRIGWGLPSCSAAQFRLLLLVHATYLFLLWWFGLHVERSCGSEIFLQSRNHKLSHCREDWQGWISHWTSTTRRHPICMSTMFPFPSKRVEKFFSGICTRMVWLRHRPSRVSHESGRNRSWLLPTMSTTFHLNSQKHPVSFLPSRIV